MNEYTDTERLDWLLKRVLEGTLDLDHDGETGRWYFQSAAWDTDYPSARAAIDAEMDFERSSSDNSLIGGVR